MIFTLDQLNKPIAWPKLFNGDINEAHLEIGVGKGRYLKEIAFDRPDIHFVGIEKSIKWFRKAEEKLHTKLHLENVALIQCYAEDFLSEHTVDKSFDAIHIMFPDPWPKRRHQGRRIFSHDNIIHFHRILKNKKTIFFATDFQDYFKSVKQAFLTNYCNLFEFNDVEAFQYTSNFQAKYEKEKRTMSFAKITKLI